MNRKLIAFVAMAVAFGVLQEERNAKMKAKDSGFSNEVSPIVKNTEPVGLSMDRKISTVGPTNVYTNGMEM